MTWIYFFLTRFHGIVRIKIGEGNVSSRGISHRSSSVGRVDAKLLAAVRGVTSDEKSVHRYFADELEPECKEVFVPSERLTNYIRWLRDQWFVVTEEALCKRGGDCEVAFSEWAPNKERQKSPEPAGPLFDVDYLDFPEAIITGDDFYTAPALVDAARQVMGGIDLDPASHRVANTTVKARRFFTVTENGLSKQWDGRVWLNPPFGHWKEWVPKIVTEWKRGNVEQMCIYAASRTLTAKYFRPLLDTSHLVCIVTGRYANWGPKATSTPDDGHVIFYLGDNHERFHAVFGSLGVVAVLPSGMVVTC